MFVPCAPPVPEQASVFAAGVAVFGAAEPVAPGWLELEPWVELGCADCFGLLAAAFDWCAVGAVRRALAAASAVPPPATRARMLYEATLLASGSRCRGCAWA